MNKNNDQQTRLAVLAEMILIGVLAAIALVVLEGWPLMLALNICGLLLLYRLARSLQKHLLQRRLDELSTVVRELTKDLSANITYDAHSELTPFYTEIESLRTTLAEQEAKRQSMMQIVNTVATNIELEKMLEDIMPQVIEATRSVCSAFYLINTVTNMLEIKHSIGFSKNLYAEFDLSLSEGIVGVTARSREIRILRDVPEDTVYLVRTFLGTIKPRNIMAVPVVNQDQLLGVLMLVSLYEYTQEHLDNMGLMRYYLGVAVHNGITYEKNKRLTNELKFQNKLIQDLNSDLERKVLDRTMFLNDVIDSIKDYAIYALDTNGVINAWNAGAENLLEFKAAEVVGKHAEVIHPNDPDRLEKVQRRIDSALRDGRYTESGWRQKQNGTSYYFEMTLFARYNQTGEVVGFTNVTRDMTAYKKAAAALGVEKEFSARIMETSTSALMLLDNEATVVIANSRARDIFHSYEATGHSFYNYCKNENDVRAKFNSVLENSITLDFPVVLRSSGQTANLNVSLIKDPAGMIRMLFVSIAEG